VSVDRRGEVSIVASNVYNGSEFAGVCFSPDGRFMFVNLQRPGLTLVIRGPFRLV
jgi:secreted PhoX family phosphatase